MAQIGNSFRFTGTFTRIKEGGKLEEIKEITSKNNPKWSGRVLNFNIKTQTGNQLVQLFGGKMEGGNILAFSKEKDEKGKAIKLEIPYSKRFEKGVIDSVANFNKNSILDREFITELDAIDYIEENMIDFDGKRVTVTGKVDFDTYKGKVLTRYQVQNIYDAKDDSKDGFFGNLALFVTSNSITEDYKKGKEVNYKLVEKERKIPVEAYVEQYNKDKESRKEKPHLYLPITTFINVSDKFDFDNDSHMKALKFRIETLMIKKGIWEIGMEVRFFKGQESEEIKEEDLTKFEKAQIESGVKTFDEIAKGKQGYGDFKEEIQLKSFHSKYTDGLLETDLTEDNLEDLFFEPEEESEDKKETTDVEKIDDDEDLF